MWVCLAASAPAFGAFLATQRRKPPAAATSSSTCASWEPANDLRGLLGLLTGDGNLLRAAFALAQYLQGGLGLSAPLRVSSCCRGWPLLVSPARSHGACPPGSALWWPAQATLLMAPPYLLISADLLTGQFHEALLPALLGVGGLGLGSGFNALIAHLTGRRAFPLCQRISAGVGTTRVAEIGGCRRGRRWHRLPGSGTSSRRCQCYPRLRNHHARSGRHRPDRRGKPYLATHAGTAVDGNSE